MIDFRFFVEKMEIGGKKGMDGGVWNPFRIFGFFKPHFLVEINLSLIFEPLTSPYQEK